MNLITQTIGIVSVIFLLPDVKARSRDNQDQDQKANETPKKRSNFCLEFFDPSHVKEAINVLRTPRPNNRRKILNFVVLLNAIVFATIGEDDLYILYGRKALNWTTEFSVFVSYYTVIGIIGTGIAIIVFSKTLKLADTTLAMISSIGSFIANPILVSK